MPSGALHYVFTWKKDFGEPTKMVEASDYCIYSLESGANTGYEHYQGYAKLKQKRTLTWLKQHVHNQAHFEVKRGTVKQAIDYCKKGDTHIEGPWEFGDIPVEQGARSDLTKVVEEIQRGDSIDTIATNNPVTFIRNYRGIYEFRNVTMPVPSEKPIVWLLWGDPNTGKSFFGRTLGTSYYTVPVDADKPWFNHYEGEDVLMVDEYNGQWNINWFKTFLEDRKCNLPTKGGYTKNRSKYIVITSNHNPRSWYNGSLSNIDYVALMRRIDFCYCVRGSSFDTCTYIKDAKFMFLNNFDLEEKSVN